MKPKPRVARKKTPAPTALRAGSPRLKEPPGLRKLRLKVLKALPVIVPIAPALAVVQGLAPAMRLLTLNRRGADVAAWQKLLADQGFNPGAIDGFFGGNTRLATIAFQKQHGLDPDGVVGAATRAAAHPLGFKLTMPLQARGAIHGKDDVIDHIGGVPIFETSDGGAVYFKTGMTIDADGAYRAYKIRNLGLDYDDNGKNPCAPNGKWIGVVTDAAGRAIPQSPYDPSPGYLISTTSLQDFTRASIDPMRYVDSESIPYIVLPGGHLGRASLGNYAMVVNTENGKVVHAIAADAGPKSHVGEASIAVARALLDEGAANPRNGGTERAIIRYLVFPGSGDHQFPSSDPRHPAILVRTLMHINQRAASLFAALEHSHQAALMV